MILGVVQALVERHGGRAVVLVSKDINMRVKARALGLPAEDYWSDKTLDDGDLLHTGLLRCRSTSGTESARTSRAGSRVAPPSGGSAGPTPSCRSCS
jgi:PhoH-like ATPase